MLVDDKISKKKAILVVSFGTTYRKTRELTIESVEEKVKLAFPDYEVRRAFTSRTVIKRLAERDGIAVDNEIQALERLRQEGYRQVFVQPLHIVAGEEFDKVKNLVDRYKQGELFEVISLGRPVLFYGGQEEFPDDYRLAIDALKPQLSLAGGPEAVVLMGHGGVHPANAAYAALQLKLEDAGLTNVFVYTVEGFPSLERVIVKLQDGGFKKVTLVPFMLVAGDHALNDMAGDDDDSAKSRLEAAGFVVNVYMHGLGENPAIQDIYIEHLKDAISRATN